MISVTLARSCLLGSYSSRVQRSDRTDVGTNHLQASRRSQHYFWLEFGHMQAVTATVLGSLFLQSGFCDTFDSLWIFQGFCRSILLWIVLVSFCPLLKGKETPKKSTEKISHKNPRQNPCSHNDLNSSRRMLCTALSRMSSRNLCANDLYVVDC